MFTPLSVLYLAVLVWYVVVKCQHNFGLALWLKMATSTVFLLLAGAAISSTSLTVFNGCVLLSLVFGFFGDYFLDMKFVVKSKGASDSHTFWGFGSFMIAHVFTFIGMLMTPAFAASFETEALLKGAAVALAGSGIVIGTEKAQQLNFGKFKLISFVYGAQLIFITFLAVFTAMSGDADASSSSDLVAPATVGGYDQKTLMAYGLVSFLLSDVVLSQSFFGKDKHTTPFIIANYVFYYGAQWILTVAMLASE